MNSRAAASDQKVVITRTFDAPRSLIYRLFTEPKFVERWWGIEGSINPVCEMDVRPGGRWRVNMRTQSGRIHPNEFVFIEVVKDERLVYEDLFNPTADCTSRPDHHGLHVVTFEDGGESRTSVTITTQFASTGARARAIASGMVEGIGQGFDRLRELLVSLHPVASVGASTRVTSE